MTYQAFAELVGEGRDVGRAQHRVVIAGDAVQLDSRWGERAPGSEEIGRGARLRAEDGEPCGKNSRFLLYQRRAGASRLKHGTWRHF